MTESTLPRNFFARYRALIVLSMLLSFPLLGWQAWQSLRDCDNSVRQWLPDDNRETVEFDWFIERFHGDEIVAVSWEGCTIDDPRLEQLARELENNPEVERSRFDRIQTSTRLLDQLTGQQFGLSRAEAIKRLTHSFVGQDGRTGCAVLSLSDEGKSDRHESMSELRRVAEQRCGIPADALRFAGPVVDNVALDVESQRTIRKYLPICIVLVLIASTWALRSVYLTGCVFLIALYNAFFSLALLRWCGGQMNLVLIMLPTLVYVLSISSAVHLVNYYCEAKRRLGRAMAVRGAVSDGWKPCLFASLTTALGLASLGISEIAPVRDFGIFCAISIAASFVTTLLFLPALLESSTRRSGGREDAEHKSKATEQIPGQFVGAVPHPAVGMLSHYVCRHRTLITGACFAVIIALGLGLIQTTSSVRILGNFSDEHRILQDYDWMESNIGPMIPVEVVIVFDDSVALSNLQRVETIRRASETINTLEHVAGTVSAATFMPAVPFGSSPRDVYVRDALSARVEQATSEFSAAGLLSVRPNEQAWRISARIKALEDIDYGTFIDRIRKQTEPVLVDQAGGRLDGVRVTITGVIPIVYRAQRQLLNDLAMSFVTAFVIISLVTAFVVRSFAGGCVAMIPNLFPVLIVFGSMGLLGLPVRISAVLTASAALGIAVDDTLHFFTWVRRAVDQGADRQLAVKEAFARCAPAMFQTTLINGVGMLVYASTIFLPTRLFATLMFSLLAAALVGDLVFLPALLAGPLGKFLREKKQSRGQLETGRLQKPGLVRLLTDSVAPSAPSVGSAVPAMAATAAPREQSTFAAGLITPRRRRNASVDDVVFALYKAPRLPSPHIPIGDFATNRDAARRVPTAYHQACRKILGSAPVGETPILLFASAQASNESAGAIGSLAIAMTDYIDGPALAIDMSRNAALTTELEFASANASTPIRRSRTDWQDSILQTHVPGLRLLPKRSGKNGIALAALRELLAGMRSKFGLVMIDVGAYDETSLPPIASACSGAFLTLRLGATQKSEVRAASRWLEAGGAQLTGCLLIEGHEPNRQDGRIRRRSLRQTRIKRRTSKLAA